MAEYKLITTEGRAKRGEFKTVHGTIQTPVFMNVGTIAAIKGAVSTVDVFVQRIFVTKGNEAVLLHNTAMVEDWLVI